MNTGTVLTAAGVILTAVFTFLGGYFARKGDNNARLTERYYDDAEFNANMTGALRTDYWAVVRVLDIDVRRKWHALIDGLPKVCSGKEEDVRALMERIGEFPAIPEPTHLDVERKHMEKRSKDKKE